MSNEPKLMTAREAVALFSLPAQGEEPEHLTVGEYAIAHDRYWAVRLPACCIPDTGDEEGRGGKLSELIDSALESVQHPGVVLSDMDLGLPLNCRICEGSGRVKKDECESCDGDGEFYHYGYYYDCKKCDSAGEEYSPAEKNCATAVACPACCGTGYALGRPDAVQVDGVCSFATARLQLLARVEGLVFRPDQPEKCRGVFTFPLKEGGVATGLLMGVRV